MQDPTTEETETATAATDSTEPPRPTFYRMPSVISDFSPNGGIEREVELPYFIECFGPGPHMDLLSKILELPPSFSRTSAMRKLLECLESADRASACVTRGPTLEEKVLKIRDRKRESIYAAFTCAYVRATPNASAEEAEREFNDWLTDAAPVDVQLLFKKEPT